MGTVLDPDNLHERVLRPACEQAGVAWAGFHTFRHTVASRLFAQDRNVVQAQRWLGHHAPSFTLDTYVHLLDGDLGAPLTANKVQTEGRTPAPCQDAQDRGIERNRDRVRGHVEHPQACLDRCALELPVPGSGQGVTVQ